VAINMKPNKGPWGGASSFIWQLHRYLVNRGFDVVYSLSKQVDVIVLIDPRTGPADRCFGVEEIKSYQDKQPDVKVIHRVNECDQRKSTDFMDAVLERANRVADFTVFISDWLFRYHADRWFDDRRAWTVIYNGADPRVFFPARRPPQDAGSALRIVTHHWSSHHMKGFPVYAELDGLIQQGVIEDVELWVAGRWPSDLTWHTARLFPPTKGMALAGILRQCDIYITASLWEPGGMHHVEGAQCGLPVLYHEDGGGIVDMCCRYGVAFRDDLVAAFEHVRKDMPELRRKVFQHMPSGDQMVHDYANIIQRLVAGCE
jgi:glycosyltransferase involved in cell wall biosynthesis